MYICIYVHVRIYICMYICIYTHTYIDEYINACATMKYDRKLPHRRTHTCRPRVGVNKMHVDDMYIYIYTNIKIHTHACTYIVASLSCHTLEIFLQKKDCDTLSPGMHAFSRKFMHVNSSGDATPFPLQVISYFLLALVVHVILKLYVVSTDGQKLTSKWRSSPGKSDRKPASTCK